MVVNTVLHSLRTRPEACKDRVGRDALTDLWIGHLERVGHELSEAEAIHHHLLRRRVDALDQHLGI